MVNLPLVLRTENGQAVSEYGIVAFMSIKVAEMI